MNITKYVNALPYKNALSPGHLALATIGTQYYGVPYLADLSVLWYNKTLFARAGLNPNNPPTNYAQIVTDAEKISALGPWHLRILLRRATARAAWASPCCHRCGLTAST